MVKSQLWAVGLGLLTVFSQVGFAADEIAARPYCPCPPAYGRPVCPPGQVIPGHIPTTRPQDATPNDLPSDTPRTDIDPMADPNVPNVDPGAADPGLAPPPAAPNSGGPDVSRQLAGTGAGATTPMLGRLDASNRMNLFDNMTAIPRSRVWIAYLNAEGQNTGRRLGPSTALVGGRSNLDIYRVGVELALTCDTSVSIQGQYVNPYDTAPTQPGGAGGLDEDWTDPQFMLKHVVYRDTDCCCNNTVVSATLGFQFEASNDPNVIDNDGSRVYPGMLFYKEHSPKYFSQGGMQVGIPIGEDPATFDWSYSLGYWAYQHRSLDCGYGGCDTPFLVGIAPQIGILGKHVLGDNDVQNPFRSNIGVVLDEPRHVFDVTAGTTLLFRNDVSMGLGYSFPITGEDSRRGEFIASLNWYF